MLDAFKLAKNLHKAGKFATLWNQDFIKRAFFNAILSNIDTKAEQGEKVEQMREVLDTRLKQKVILSFKYYQLTKGSENMIREKLNRMLQLKALNSLKYFTVSQRIQTSFIKYRTAKIRNSMFQRW